MKRRLLSIALALAMVITMIPTSAFAAEVSDGDNDGTIHYVSLGASNTNGYGHRRYLPPEVTEDPLAASKAKMNVYGYGRAPENAYPAQVAEELENITGKDVELHQLAISSMRTEELRVLLDDEYYGDDYTEWRFTGVQGWFEIACDGGLKALRDEYQKAITTADLITIDIGWNNFGVYAFNNIKTILADGHYWKAPVMEDILTENEQVFYGNLKEIALDYLESNAGMADPALQDKLALMADVLAYAAMGACHHFDIVLEKIYELNPDATVVSINIQNLADGLVVDFEGTELKLGELYGKLIEMTDLYRATTCPYADRYLYADAGDVDTFLDEIVAWDGDPTTLTDDTKDCFDMYDDSLYVRSIVEYMMVGQALSGLFAGFRDMAAGYGLEVFKNDGTYTYEFALTRTPEQLLALDLSKLDLKNPAGSDADVEAYGAAVAKHLKNLRGEQPNVSAYDYIFENLLKNLEGQKANVVNGLTTIFNGINAAVKGQSGNDPGFSVDGYYKVLTDNNEAVVNDGTRADFVAKFYADYTAEGENANAQFKAYLGQQIAGMVMNESAITTGLKRAADGYAQIVQGIEEIVPLAKAEFAAKLEGVYNTYNNTLNYAYDVVATIVQYAASVDALEINADTLNGFNTAANGMMNLVANDFINGAMAKFNYELYANGLSDTVVGPVPDYVLNESIITPAVRAIAVLAVRYELGNSFFAHPNTVGHDQITDAVFEALATDLTAKDYSDEQLTAAWNWLMDYAQANYPETYDVFMQVADYVGSEEFAALCVELEVLYNRLDSATTPEQKARLAEETYKLVTRLQEIAAMATADKVENIDYYVSIGDSTLSGYGLEGYTIGSFNGEGQKIGNEAPILLAKKLFGENYEEYFEKLDKGGLRTNDILVWLGLDEYKDDFYDRYTIDENAKEKNTAYYQELYRTEIEKADLITLTLGGGDVSTFIEKQIIALRTTGSTYTLDWTKYFPDADLTEIYGYIETVTQLLDGTLPEIMGVEAEDLAPVVAESFLYGFIGYVNNYSKIVDRIHEMNPDAHIVLVGYFNTVDDMMMPVTIQGETIQLPIGAMLGMLVETSNANTLSYALANNEYTTYVSTSEATTILDEQGIFDYESRLNGLIAQTWQTHAGPEGHKYIAEQIYAAITTEYTNEEIAAAAWEAFADYGMYLGDEFGDEVLAALNKLIHESYAYAYDYAEQNGYIDDAIAGIDEAIKAIESIDLSGTEATDEFKAEVEKAKAEIIDTLKEAQKLIAEADELDEETLNDLMTLLGEAEDAGLVLLDTLAQAGVDVTQLAIIPTLNELIIPELEKAVEEGSKWLMEQAQEAYEALVEAAVEAAQEYGPKVADAIYDYLYNNPEEIIAFVKEYGDEFVDFVAEYGDEALAVLGYIAVNYGDEIVNFVIENHEEILDTMIAWYEVHGENTWALIDVYLEALGVYDAAEDLYEDLEDKLDDAASEIMDAIEDAIAELEAEIEELEGILEDLKAELEDLKAELENAAEDAKAEIEAAIAEIEKAIEEIEAAIEVLKEKVEELTQIAEDIYNAVQDVIDAALMAGEDLEAALEAMQEALADLAEAIEAAEEFLSEINDTIASVVGTIADVIEFIADINAEYGETVAEIVETIIDILMNAEEIIADIQDAIEYAAEEIMDAYEAFKEALYNATHALVYACAVDSYVALGGTAVEAGGYVAELAEELGVTATNLGDATVDFTGLVDYVTANAAAIYGADVITYQMEATAFITTFVNAVLSDTSYDIYLDEEAQVYVDKIEEALLAKLAEEYDEAALEIAAPIAQKLVYAMVAYAVETVEALETINAINPEATVLVVGMYNPLPGVTVVLDGEEIAIGEMAEYVIDATDLYYLVYAVASGNVKFVAASDTEVTGVVSEINIDAIEAAVTAILEMMEEIKSLEDMQKVQAAIEALTAEALGMYNSIVTASGSQDDIYENIMDVLTVEDHKWALSGVTAPTCTEAGYTTYECELCGEEKTEDIMDAIGHAWGAWTDNGDGTHSRVCANDASHVETAAHDFTNGDCDCGAKKPAEEEDHKPSGGSSRDWHCPTCKSDVCHSKAYTDLDLGEWYHEYTDYVLCKKLMIGMSDTIFAPNAETTRAMLTTILYRIAGAPAVTGEMPFADVAEGQWYSDAILWAAQNDVVLGYGDGNFGPMDVITREQIAALFCRFAELKGVNVNKSVELSPAYDDASDVGAWAVDYVEWAVATGLMQGRSTHMLAPAAGTTRAEVATLLERWCEEIAD